MYIRVSIYLSIYKERYTHTYIKQSLTERGFNWRLYKITEAPILKMHLKKNYAPFTINMISKA